MSDGAIAVLSAFRSEKTAVQFFDEQINKTYTSHLGRRTYASIMRAHNAPMEVVAAALGDNVSTTIKYYAKVLDSTIIKQQIEVFK